jgi:hypothetical protein
MSLQIGRVTLDESEIRPFDESWSSDNRVVSLTGVLFNNATRSVAAVTDMHDDILGLPESLVPLIYGGKAHRNGYYTVVSSKSSLVHLTSQQIVQLTWAIDLIREGSDSEVDLEARMAGPANRLNDFTLSGNRWISPPAGFTAFWAGGASPSSVSRLSPEGNQSVFLGLAETLAAIRFRCPIASYANGRARILSDGRERAGVGVKLNASGWVLSNGFTQLGPRNGGLWMSYYDGAFSPQDNFNLSIAGATVGFPNFAQIMRNDYEQCTLRLVWNRSPQGRLVGDFTIRRGGRFVDIVLKTDVSTTIGLTRTPNEAGTAGSGFVRATSNDAQGDRYVVGSSRTFTNDLTAGGLSKSSTVRLDLMLGFELNGSTAITGDQAANLMAQYLGSPSVKVVAVRQ